MTYQTLQLTQDGAVTTVWLNRPEVRNAFNDAAIAEITASPSSCLPPRVRRS